MAYSNSTKTTVGMLNVLLVVIYFLPLDVLIGMDLEWITKQN